jgi:pimeloyl-ACP methyl ester carboxylesterase
MNTSFVKTLNLSEGSIAYEESGTGPLVVCLPGMGDLRSNYRHLTPALVAAGYRVVVADLRGHGDSSATFPSYGDEDTARDTAALIEHLGGPAVIIGSSMGSAAAALVAAQRPELVSGLVLIGPFVRNPKISPLTAAMMKIATAAPWVAATWKMYLPSLYAGRKPDDLPQYLVSVTSALKRPGYAAAFSRTTRASHAAAERALPAVSSPTLVVMGERDPDFPDPAEEARWVAEQVHGTPVMVPDAGHYPQSQRPDIVAPAVLEFLASIVRLRG